MDDEELEESLTAARLGAKLLGKLVAIADQRDPHEAARVLGPATRPETDAALLLASGLIAEHVPMVRVLELSASAERFTGEA